MTAQDPSAQAELAFVGRIVADAMAAGAGDAQARLSVNERTEVDFDTRRLSLLRTTHEDETLLTIFKAARKGSATLTGRGEAAAAHAIAEALAAAEAAPADEANGLAPSEPGPATLYGPAEADREHLIDRCLEHIETMAREFPAIVAREAYHQFNRTRRSFANSAGLARQETRGRYSFATLFAARRDGRTTSFNFHGVSSYNPFGRLIEVGALRQLYGDLERSFEARPLAGKFTGDVIITPDALEEMVIVPLVRVLGGYSLIAGTSPYKEKRGRAIAGPLFSLLNRPRAASFPEGIDFDAFGIPTRDLDVVKDGVLEDFLVDFYASRKLGIPVSAVYSAFVVPPGEKPLAEIIAGTARGIILTRYSGGVPSDNLDFSGIAKNAFYIEDGKVRHALAETMISGNLRDLLLAVHAVSRETVNFGTSELASVAAGGVTIHGRG